MADQQNSVTDKPVRTIDYVPAEPFGIQVGTFRPATQDEVDVLSERAKDGDSSIIFVSASWLADEVLVDDMPDYTNMSLRMNFWRNRDEKFTPPRGVTLIIPAGPNKEVNIRGEKRSQDNRPTRRAPLSEHLVCENCDIPSALAAQCAAQGINRRVIRGAIRLTESTASDTLGDRIMYFANLGLEASVGSVGEALTKAMGAEPVTAKPKRSKKAEAKA